MRSRKQKALDFLRAYGGGEIQAGILTGEYPAPLTDREKSGVAEQIHVGGTVTGRWSDRKPNFTALKPCYNTSPTARNMARVRNKSPQHFLASYSTGPQKLEKQVPQVVDADYSEIERRVLAWHQNLKDKRDCSPQQPT